MRYRVFSYIVTVTRGADECYAVGAEVRGISRDPEKAFYHERRRRLLVEGYFSPPEECAVSIRHIQFCWSIQSAPYVSWLQASEQYPLPKSCGHIITYCKDITQLPKRLDLEAFSLNYGFYTVQYGISLKRDSNQGSVL